MLKTTAAAMKTLSAFNLPDLAILVVEDNPMNQQLILAVLEQWGFCPGVVDGGEQALDLLQARALENRPFEIVVMDVQMPELDGLSTTEQIRTLAIEQPWIIGLSANAFQEDREKALAVGMNDYLTKPFRMGTLAAALGRGVSGSRPGLPAAAPLVECLDSIPGLSAPEQFTREREPGAVGGAGDERTEEIPGEMPEEIPGEMPEEIPGEMPEEIPSEVSDEIASTLRTLRRHLGGAVVGDLITTFLEETPLQICQIQTALARQDYGTIARNAHNVKGSSLSLGARHLGQRCLILEQWAGSQGMSPAQVAEAIAQLLVQLEQDYSQVARVLTQEVA
jgi:CheY-like chemotaxis protein